MFRLVSKLNHLNVINIKHNQIRTLGSLAISPEMRAVITRQSENLEQRKIRQQMLFDKYVNGIKFQDNGFIDVSKLAVQHKYAFEPSYVLLQLYLNGLDKIGKKTNMFSLPEKQIIITDKIDFKNHDNFDHRKIFERYKQQISVNNSLQKLERIVSNKNLGVILKRNDDYDFVRLETKFDRIDDSDSGIRTIYEYKKSNSGIDYPTIKSILKISRDGLINCLDGIVIKNRFNGTHFYNHMDYDHEYGEHEFNKVLMQQLSSSMNLKGNGSIIYEKTFDLIKKTAKDVANGDKELADKLVDDFINHTTHFNGDTHIDVTELMNLYRIEGYELLYAMYRNNIPTGFAGFFDNLLNKEKANNFSLDDAKKLLEQDNSEHNYVRVDYLYGIAIKNSFRKKMGDEQTINIHKYDSRSSGNSFYQCMMILMNMKRAISD